jgi:hypothetical protein
VYQGYGLSFEILSVGQTGIDEGGQGNPNPNFGDDIVIRFMAVAGRTRSVSTGV